MGGGGEDAKELLHREKNQNHETGDEGPDCSAVRPGPGGAAECEGEDEGGVEACVEDGADPVELLQFCEP